MDDSLIKRVKEYVKKKGTTVTKLVATYFAVLKKDPSSIEDLPPITTSLSGILQNTDIKESDYQKLRKEKHF